MLDAHQIIVEAASKLAGRIPKQMIESLAEDIRTYRTEHTNHHKILGGIAQPAYRDLASDLLKSWKSKAANLSPEAVAIALLTAAHSEEYHRKRQSVELVWTGPKEKSCPFRRTEQAILEVLDSARERITLVSFAVYRIPNVAKALVKAAKRGVQLTVIVETPDKIEGEGEYSTIQALGHDVAACSSVYFWPKDNRLEGESGKVGILHVKCAVADGEWLFLSSANLTQQAFTINMELGILVRGGTMPRRVEEQFRGLIRTKVLLEI